MRIFLKIKFSRERLRTSQGMTKHFTTIIARSITAKYTKRQEVRHDRYTHGATVV